MAKKQKTENVTHVEDTGVNVTQVVEQSKQQRKEPSYKKTGDGWEIKDRMYNLKRGASPLT